MKVRASHKTPQTRAHRKSRQGCGNCKLRSVKCDEQKPACKRCMAYRVLCSYDQTQSSLESLEEQVVYFKLTPFLSYWTSTNEQLLSKFQMRTALTVGFGKGLEIYQKEVIDLARVNSSLMHSIVTLTLMHDRHLCDVSSLDLSTAESYHWYQAVSSFNRQLSHDAYAHDQIALMATSAIMGTLVFCHMEAKTPDEAWPLNSPSTSAVNWLCINRGKQEVWKLARSRNHNTTVEILGSIHTSQTYTETLLDFRFTGIPPEFLRLYNIYSPTNGIDNPYLPVALGLAQILYTEFPMNNSFVGFCFFISSMPGHFKILLEDKDPRALLLLACWYAKVCCLGVWWVTRRSLLEGQAICIYLERYFKHNIDLQTILQFPKAVFSAVGPRRIQGS